MANKLISKLKQGWGQVDQPEAAVADGKSAEDFAARYLRQHHLRLVERNYTCRRGEIDLIMADSEYLVFVEVKFRSYGHYGHAEEMVSSSKQRKLIATAEHFLGSHTNFQQYACRFDVFALEYDYAQRLQVNWLKNAFTTS